MPNAAKAYIPCALKLMVGIVIATSTASTGFSIFICRFFLGIELVSETTEEESSAAGDAKEIAPGIREAYAAPVAAEEVSSIC